MEIECIFKNHLSMYITKGLCAKFYLFLFASLVEKKCYSIDFVASSYHKKNLGIAQILFR